MINILIGVLKCILHMQLFNILQELELLLSCLNLKLANIEDILIKSKKAFFEGIGKDEYSGR